MMNTTQYKSGFIHETIPDNRYPLSGQGKPRYQAQVENVTKDCNTFIGAQRAVTTLEAQLQERTSPFTGYDWQ